MVLPIFAYGQPVLRKVAADIDSSYQGLNELIADMFETMHAASGIGLAAPQVGKSIRLLVIDGTPYADDYPEMVEFKKVFINPRITDLGEEFASLEEGCLSLPSIKGEVKRPTRVSLTYYDENWNRQTATYEDFVARAFQHEYDHIEGKLFIDHLSPLKRKLVEKKLKNIQKHKVEAAYRYQ